jgi:uncharacterized protein
MSLNISTKKYFAKFIAVFLLMSIASFALSSLRAQGTEDKPGIFYAITGKGLKDTSWLFGTFHLVNGSYLDEIPQAKEKFIKSKGAVVELVIDSSQIQAAQIHTVMKDNMLTDLLEPALLDSLDKELKNNLGAGVEVFNQWKPMNVTLVLSIVHMMRNNEAKLKKYSGPALDAFFASDGKQRGKNITALETIEEQMNLLFNSKTNVEQAGELKTFLRNKTAMLQSGDELLNAWFNNDMESMNAIYQKTRELSGEMDQLVKERNLRWMKTLPGLMKKESQFIAVGALHLPGEYGLVDQLKQSGYTVTPVKL